MKNFDIVIFDFDGTIADTREGVYDSIIYAVSAYGLEIPEEEELVTFLGPPLRNSFMEVFDVDNDTALRLVEKYRELYTDNAMYRLKLFDGIEALLKKLKDNGIMVGIASSKPEKFFTKLLERLNIIQYFDVVCGAAMDSTQNEKHDIIRRALKKLPECDKSRILMVGDRKFDIDGANNLGIPSAGVLFGFGTKEELKTAGAAYLPQTPEELDQIIFS